LSNLEELNLAHNFLGNNPHEPLSIPLGISSLGRLRVLNLSSNQFTKLMGRITCLSHLRELDLSGNGLTTISHKIRRMQGLWSLNLDHNHLYDISGVEGLRLGELHVVDNHLNDERFVGNWHRIRGLLRQDLVTIYE
jgi:Leucine-rich repeat (LRR) protein